MMRDSLPTIDLFDLKIQAVTFSDACQHLLAVALEKTYDANVVVTPNVDHIVRLDHHPEFKQQYAKADYIFADGMPVVWASKMAARPLPERITGADLFVSLMKASVVHQLKIFVVGGMPGQESTLKLAFEHTYPGCQVELFCPSMQFTFDGPEGLEAVHKINAVQPDMVFVCLGMPKQENWALTHRHELKTSLVFCVGAAMEFALGVKSRAPLWMQKNGLEWLWRFMSEPRRLWRRYFVQDSAFLAICWREWQKQRQRSGSKND